MAKHFERRGAQFFIIGIGIYAISLLMPGLYFKNILSAFFFTFFVLLMILMLWPVLLKWTKRFLFTTFGIGSFLLSAFILWLASFFLPGVTISGWGLITAPLAVTLVSLVATSIVYIDDDEIYARSVHYQLRLGKKQKETNNNCFVFLEIDGLSEKVLKQAIEKGAMPTLSEWLKNGSYKIKGWETDLSSQTGASQAGILHGCNKNIPAFRWVDKSNNNKIVSSNGIGDAPLIQKQISDGKGLLSTNGAAITNLFTGDAKDNIFVYSVIKNIKQLYSESWGAFYSRPFNVAHVAVLSFTDMLVEMKSRYRQKRNNVQPRLNHRGLSYFFARAGANIALRDLSTFTVIGDIIGGDKDAIYTTFFGYDEVAHHCGVADEDCFNVLVKIDQQIKRINAAKKYGKRPCSICVLSDHGQTNGATFKQRYGLSLDELVKRLLPEKENIYKDLDTNQDHFGQMITAPSHSVKRKLSRGSKKKKQQNAQVIVLASGNLGLIYFTSWSTRLTLEEINITYPSMISGLISHEGIGFIMVRSHEHGPVILSGKGKYYLANDKIVGQNPLLGFGENAAVHLRRTDSFNHVPDILVMSFYDPEKDEVAAFEELIGSHGGLGGDQSKPFIMHPAEWNLDNEVITGAEQVYKLFKNKIEGNLPK